jgi:hypothetical protein
MLPDSILSPKAAEPVEAQLRQWELADAPASLDARMRALLAQNQGTTARPSPSARRKWLAAACALAACAAIAVLLRPQAQVENNLARHDHAAIALKTPAQVAPAAAARAAPQVFEAAVPVGYQYQGSRALYAEETPVGTVKADAGQSRQAYQRRTLLRHTFENPKTHATYEVDAPQEELILENLQSY